MVTSTYKKEYRLYFRTSWAQLKIEDLVTKEDGGKRLGLSSSHYYKPENPSWPKMTEFWPRNVP
jgi:hypothetical protein